jgi:hypothetical protein
MQQQVLARCPLELDVPFVVHHDDAAPLAK